MEVAWHNSLRAIITLGLAIVAAGILGMAAILHNQHSHMQEVKALEIEVLHRERLSALGNLAATVAHEIRNPLNAISMGLQRLKVEFQPTDDQEQYSRVTELMLGEVHRLNSIVEQFLSLARPLEIKPEALRVQDVLNELATLVEGEAQQSKVQIRVVAPLTLPPLKADREYLRQTLLNLILNGLQAMPEGGTLTLKANTSNGNFLISVTDTGIGIAPEDRRRIFEPYFTTKAKGSGLGLAIARRIIEAHGGTITVLSEADQGCCFQISLPINAYGGLSARPFSYSRSRRRTRPARAGLGFSQKQGFEVAVTGSGENALELFRRESFDLVLTDQKMPNMSGLDLLQAIRAINPETAVVLMTAYGTIEARRLFHQRRSNRLPDQAAEFG